MKRHTIHTITGRLSTRGSTFCQVDPSCTLSTPTFEIVPAPFEPRGAAPDILENFGKSPSVVTFFSFTAVALLPSGLAPAPMNIRGAPTEVQIRVRKRDRLVAL